MPHQSLHDRIIIALSGSDATSFLQGLITTNIENMANNEVRPGALLTPQGKIAFDFLISNPSGAEFYIDIHESLAASFEMKLTLYRLRADVAISKKDDIAISVSWDESILKGAGLKDMRFMGDTQVLRHYQQLPEMDEIEDGEFSTIRISHGVAESGMDFALSDIFPHDIYFDLNGAIDFKKGCYVGQEVVSRMQHRGTARRRLAIVTSDQPLPTDQTITANGKTIGAYLTSYGHQALAIVRTDRWADAQKQGHAAMVNQTDVRISFPKIASDHGVIDKAGMVL